MILVLKVGFLKDNLQANNLKGLIFTEMNRYFQALESFEKALEIDPNYTEALVNIGKLFVKIGNYDEAMKYFDKP